MAVTVSPSTVTLQSSNSYKQNITVQATVTNPSYSDSYSIVVQVGAKQYTKTVYIMLLDTDVYGCITSFSLDVNDFLSSFDSTTSVNGTVRFRRNSTVIQTGSFTVNLNAPPQIHDVSISSNFSSDNSVYIEGITTCNIQCEIDPQLGATIQRNEGDTESQFVYEYEGQTWSQEADLTLISGIYSGSSANTYKGNAKVRIKATDSRGMVAYSNWIQFYVKEHLAPTLNTEIFRCDANGDKDMAGGYFSVTAWASANPSDLSISTLEIAEIDINDQTNYVGYSLSNGVTSIVGSSELGVVVDTDSEYAFTITAVDNYQLQNNVTVTIPKVKRIINVKNGGTGIAFGKLASTASLTDSAWDINTDGEYLVQGQPLVDTLPDASFTERGLISTGAQVFAGQKVFGNGTVSVGNAAVYTTRAYTIYDFRDNQFSSSPTTGSGTRTAYILNYRTAIGSSLNNRLAFIVRSPKSDGTGYATGYEGYKLPVVANDLSNQPEYDIWTTKSIPAPPTTNGTYTLKATVSNGTVTYSWV